MRLLAVTKRLFHHRQIAERIGRVTRLFEILRGRVVIARFDRQLAKLLENQRRDDMIVFTLKRHGSLQIRYGLARLPFVQIGHRQLRIDPAFRPMILLARLAAERVEQGVGESILRADRSHDFLPPLHRQHRAADDLRNADIQQLRRRDDLRRVRLKIQEQLPLLDLHVLIRGVPNLRRAIAAAPRRDHIAQVGLHRRREMDLRHPIRKRQLKLQRRVVVLQRVGVFACVVVALADHRVVADRVDPAAIRSLAAEVQIRSIAFQGKAIVAVVERADVGVIHLHRQAAAADRRTAGNRNHDARSNGLSWLNRRLIRRRRQCGRSRNCQHEGECRGFEVGNHSITSLPAAAVQSAD